MEDLALVKFISFVATALACCFAFGQVPSGTDPKLPVVDLGDIVSNVVIAKVQRLGPEAELTIAKFGRNITAGKTKKVTVYRVETKTRLVVVDGKETEQNFTVNVPETTEIVDSNFTPTEQSRSVPLSSVQAFDINGKVVDVREWSKTLEVPKHVLLLNTPISETKRLNPFFAKILRDDILLLYLKNIPIEKERD